MGRIEDEQKEATSWAVWGTILFIILATFILAMVVVFGSTAKVVDVTVDRMAMENSYQYTAAQKAQRATYEAQMAELGVQLINADAPTGRAIKAQMAAIRVRLAAIRGEER